MVFGKVYELLSLGHGGPTLHPCEDDRLALSGHCVLLVEDGCGTEERTDSGDDLVGYAQFVESVHLLPVCTVDGRVACVDTDAFLAFLLRLLHDVYDLIQVHHGTVVDDRTFLVSGQYVGVDQ